MLFFLICIPPGVPFFFRPDWLTSCDVHLNLFPDLGFKSAVVDAAAVVVHV